MPDTENMEATMTDVAPIVDPVGSDGTSSDQIIPGVYQRPLSWKNWVRRALPFMAIGVAAFAALVVLAITALVDGWPKLLLVLVLLLLAAASGVMTYREYWRWQHSPYYADPEQGVLFQYQAKNKWLFLLGSDPRTLDLDTADYLPAPQTFWENYLPLEGFRHACTITIDGPGQQDAEHFSDIRDFMYGEQISAIILFRKDRDQRQQVLDLGLQERQAVAAEQTVTLLVELTTLVERLVLAVEANGQSIEPQPQPSQPEPSTGTPADTE